MVKGQKQHSASPTSSHLPQSPSFLCKYSWEAKHPFTVSEMGFHSAAMAVSGLIFCPSLSVFSSPFSSCSHIWNPAPHLFMWSVLFLSFLSFFFNSYLKAFNLSCCQFLSIYWGLQSPLDITGQSAITCPYTDPSEQHHCSNGRPK